VQPPGRPLARRGAGMAERRPAQAAYHGVPLVTVPGHVVDQADNAVKAARLGFCIPVYLGRNFSADALHGALLRVLAEPGFRAAAARVATRMRARRRSPAEEAVGAGQRRVCVAGYLLFAYSPPWLEHALLPLFGLRQGLLVHHDRVPRAARQPAGPPEVFHACARLLGPPWGSPHNGCTTWAATGGEACCAAVRGVLARALTLGPRCRLDRACGRHGRRAVPAHARR